jgi:RNA polymerase sigma-70 factor (ECF subfamily)
MEARSNQEWITALRTAGPQQEAALADLNKIILSGLPYALSKYLSPSDPKFQTLAENTAQETLLRVLEKLDTFEGRSQFTTWVHKIAIHIALTELRRKRWENVSLEEIVGDEDRYAPAMMLADPQPGPEKITESADLLQRIQYIIMEELTDKQRQLHDGRLRLKKRLAQEGLTPEDVLSVFERE